MEKLKQSLRNYEFDLNDIRAIVTILNVILVILFGWTGCLLGLCVALIGLLRDITKKKKLNSYLIHISNCVLNLYLLTLLGG